MATVTASHSQMNIHISRPALCCGESPTHAAAEDAHRPPIVPIVPMPFIHHWAAHVAAYKMTMSAVVVAERYGTATNQEIGKRVRCRWTD